MSIEHTHRSYCNSIYFTYVWIVCTSTCQISQPVQRWTCTPSATRQLSFITSLVVHSNIEIQEASKQSPHTVDLCRGIANVYLYLYTMPLAKVPKNGDSDAKTFVLYELYC